MRNVIVKWIDLCMLLWLVYFFILGRVIWEIVIRRLFDEDRVIISIVNCVINNRNIV